MHLRVTRDNYFENRVLCVPKTGGLSAAKSVLLWMFSVDVIQVHTAHEESMGEEIGGWPIGYGSPSVKHVVTLVSSRPRGLGIYGLESNLKLKFGGARRARAMTDVTAE